MAASFTATVAGRDVAFDASASTLAGTITDWKWEFGDAIESGGETVTHTYLGQLVSFNVTLTVFDNLGNQDSDTQAVAPGAAIFVATTGLEANAGTIASPYDLASVFDGTHTAAVGAGGTIWMRGGTYNVNPLVQLWPAGAAGNPCVIRSYPGERAVIDGPILMRSTYVELRDMEIMRSDPTIAPDRVGVQLFAVGQRLVNLIVHDCRKSGISAFDSVAGELLIDGVVSYNNGTTGGQDHGLYVASVGGASATRKVRGNVLFNNWGHGVHAYTETPGNLHDIEISENTSFLNGSVVNDQVSGVLVSGTAAADIVCTDNRTRQTTETYPTLTLGDSGGGNDGLTYTGNYLVGDENVAVDWVNDTQSGNTVVAPSSPPGSGQIVAVRASPIVGGTGIVTVFSWAGASTASVDVSSILRRGDTYAVYHVYDLATTVLTGTYDGSTHLAFPMAAVTAPAPLVRAYTAPPSTGTTFHAFVVKRTAQSYLAPASGEAGLNPFRRRRR